MNRLERIKDLLGKNLNPKILQVIDDSINHHGHKGNNSINESHYTIVISMPETEGVSLLEKHRLIKSLLSSEFKSGLHSVSIKILD